MIELEMTKDIRKYKTKLYLGLTARQCICMALAVITCVFIFFKLGYFEDMTMETKFTICVFAALPFVAIGWIEMYGMPFEKFAMVVVQNAFLNPKRRPYKIEGIKTLEEIEKEEQRLMDDIEISPKERKKQKKELKKQKKAKIRETRRKKKDISSEFRPYK